MIATLKALNLAVRFGLEVALLAALTIYAWRAAPAGPVRLAGAIAVPVLAMVVWATVVHGAGVPAAARIVTQVALFAFAVGAVAGLHRLELAGAFGAAVLANAALMAAWGQ